MASIRLQPEAALAVRLDRALKELQSVTEERDALKRLLEDRPTDSRMDAESSTSMARSLAEDVRRPVSESVTAESKIIADLETRLRRLEVDKTIAIDDKNDLEVQLRKEEVRTLELVWMNEETQAKLRKCEEERTFLLNDSYHSMKKMKEVMEEAESLRQVAKDHAHELGQREETISRLEGDRAKLKGLLQARDDEVFRLTREKGELEGQVERLKAELNALAQGQTRGREKEREGSKASFKASTGIFSLFSSSFATTAPLHAQTGTTVSGAQTSTTISGAQASTTVSSAQASTTISGAQASTTISGAQASATVQGVEASACVICGRTNFRTLQDLTKHSARCTDYRK